MWGRSLGDKDAPSWPQAQEPEASFGSTTHTREVEPQLEQSERDTDMDR